ncbi:hypothetical protein [Ralstonia pseudosolanacearum]|uniref:hypothetical protein n=1 Tax=Ralstonia pseudosolanacearum TaxID=1310165 RepID=UPI003CEC34A4
MSTLVLARVTLVIFAFIFTISFQRRKTLFTVKNADQATQGPLIEGLLKGMIRDNRLALILSGFFGSLALAYVIYTLYFPAAIA